MSQNLRKYLKILNDSLPGNTQGDAGNYLQASFIVGDIIRDCQSLNNDSDAAIACSILFHENDGILCFLRKCALNEQFFGTRLKLVDYFKELIDRFSSYVLCYAEQIKSVFLLMYNRDNKALMRKSVIQVIMKLLIACSGKQVGTDLNSKQIMDKFLLDLATNSKISPTVKQVIFELLGNVVSHYPEHVDDYSDRVLKIYLQELDTQMKSKTKAPDFPIICGCFCGLTALLTVSRLSNDEQKRIYQFIKLAMSNNKEVKRFEYIRAVLYLFVKHASVFRGQIYEDWLKTFENLKEWLNYTNRDVKMAANSAMQSFFKQMADMIFQQLNSSPENKTETKQIFMYFADTFCNILRSQESINVAVAVQGYGYFAAPCKSLMGENEVALMFSEVIHRCDDLFFSQHEFIDERLEYLSSFISALASIILQLDKVPEMSVISLENLVVNLIEKFPMIITKNKKLSYKSIIKLCVALYNKGTIFRPFIQTIVYQGILRTCSHPIPQDLCTGATMMNVEGDYDISFRSYLELWRNMLLIVNLEDLNEIGISIDDRHAITNDVYDEIITSVLAIIAKLDFTVSKDSSIVNVNNTEISSDPVNGLQASNPKDFQIFINLVEFCKVFLLEDHITLFKRWIYIFGHNMISFSTNYPLVSGFYKLFAVVLKICSTINYFENIQNFQYNSMTNLSGINYDEKLKSYVLFTKCAKEISIRLHQYKEDLLISCFQVILSLPKEIVTEILQFLIPVVGRAISIGYSYLPIVEEVLTALENWSSEISPDVLSPLYQATIPLLNGYLLTPCEGNDMFSHVNTKSTKKRNGQSLTKDDELQVHSSTWLVKMKIIKLLGNLGTNINSIFVEDRAENIAKVALSWDSNKLMKFAVPFIDMKPTIYLDIFFSKVVELACFSGDRQCKVAATELLHTLILYLLGTQASLQSKLQLEKPITKLLSKLFPAIFKLACDPDMVVYQLFNPLMFQLIHWFSNTRPEIVNDQKALFDALMNGVANPEDVALRDLCASGIKEFLQWIIKHTSSTKLKNNPYGIKFILKRIYSLCLHPQSSLRLGAALVFNNIYTVFREENDLIDRFIIELLYHFVESLAIAEKDEKHLGTRTQCLSALSHIEKIILAKSLMLKKKNANRRKPVELENFEVVRGNDWDQILLWLLSQSGRPESECRRYCMDLVTKLSRADGKCPDVYFQAILNDKGVDYFISIFEGDGLSTSKKLQLANIPLLTDYVKNCFTISGASFWLQLLLCSLDCYTWVIRDNLLKPNDLFTRNTKFILSKSVNFFKSEIAMMDISTIISESNCVYTPGDINEYYLLKCTVVVRIFDLVEEIVKHCKDCSEEMLETMIDSSFWNMAIACVLHPLEVGFDMNNPDIKKTLPQRMSALLKALIQHLPKRYIVQFNEHFSKEKDVCIWPLAKLISKYNSCQTSAQFEALKWLLSGLRLFNEVNFLQSSLELTQPDQTQLAQQLAKFAVGMNHFLKDGTIYAKVLNRVELSVAHEVLLLSFSFGLSVRFLINEIGNSTLIKHPSRQTELTQGEHWFVAFESIVIPYLMSKANESIPYLMSNMPKQQTIYANILIAILDRFKVDSILRRNYSAVVVEKVLLNFYQMQSWWHPKASMDIKGTVLHILTQTLILDYKTPKEKEHVHTTLALDSFLALLLDSNLNLKFKGRVLDILSIFANLPPDRLIELKNGLVKMAVRHFPQKCSALQINTTQYREYISLFKKVLFAFELSGSMMLFEFIMELVCVERKHVCDESIQQTISNHMKSSNNEKQSSTIDFVFNTFKGSSGDNEEFRRGIVDKFLVPLLLTSRKLVFIQFYVNNIKQITSYLLDKPLKTSDSNYQQHLVSKLGSFTLIETLYNRCSGEELNTLESRVNTSFCDGTVKTGKELTQGITKAAHSVKKENMQGETVCLDLRRLVRCAAYNCLIAVISCTQTDVKFYTLLLFSENLPKAEYLWDNLVDISINYTFEVELDKPLERKKKLNSIRKNFRSENVHTDDNDVEISSFPLTYANSVATVLTQSSLVDDVTQFEITRNDADSYKKNRTTLDKKEDFEGVNFVELEMDLLNQHMCMMPLNGLLQHLHLFVTPFTRSESEIVMPTWMKAFHKTFSDENTSANVKLFFAKLVVNNVKVFEPYASFWLFPLMRLIVQGLAGPEINYFIIDIVVVMLSWSPKTLPLDTVAERWMTTRLLEFLIKHCFHERREILRNNLELIKTVIECWNSRLDIPYMQIYDGFKSANLDSMDNLLGIQVLGIVVSCGLPPFSHTDGLDEERFFKTLAGNINAKHKPVHSSAAEVTGLVLKFIGSRVNTDDFPFFQYVRKQISKLESNMDKFFVCTHQISKSFPAIVDSFTTKILFYLPKSRGIYRQLGLQVLLSRVKVNDELFSKLTSIGFYKFMAHDDGDVQILCLKIVNEFVNLLPHEQLLDVFDKLILFVEHSDVNCRKMMFETLIKIYDRFSEMGDGLINKIKATLLKGLGDSDLDIRSMLLNFWSHEDRLPATTTERILAMMREMYLPECENIFLSTITYLQLQLTLKSPDYKRLIFENPLSDCKFESYNVNSDWRVRHASMIPLFVESMAIDSVESTYSTDLGFHTQQIRATQENLAFTPTQNAEINWLTQGSTESFTKDFPTLDDNSNFLFKWKPSNVLGTKSTLNENNENDTSEFDMDRKALNFLKRRFVKNVEQEKKFHILRNTRMQQRRVTLQQEQKLAREAKVSLFRQYRKGDLPDIQIPYSFVIVSLQVLAQKNETIAKMLFVNLVTNTLQEAVKDSHNGDLVMTAVQDSLNSILSKTTSYSSFIISAIQEISLEFCDKFHLDIGALTLASERSFQQNTGILLLEKIVAQHRTIEDIFENVGFSDRASDDKPLWVNLVKLNKSQGNYDVVNGIVTYCFGLTQEARDIFEAEAGGNYTLALDLMKRFQRRFGLIAEDDCCELDLWNDSALLCYDRLCQWSNLKNWATKICNVEKLDLIWSDLNFERCLPYLVRSNVKLIIETEPDQEFLNFLDNGIKDLDHPERKQLLESRYSHELALVSIVQKDYNRALHYSSRSIKTFIHDWTAISELSSGHRKSHLEHLQSLVEMDTFLQLMKSSHSDISKSVVALIKLWQKSLPNVLTNVNIISDITSNRNMYLKKFESELSIKTFDESQLTEDGSDYLSNLYLQSRFAFAMNCVEAAGLQKNFSLALFQLKDSINLPSIIGDDSLRSKWVLAYCRTHQRQSVVKDSNGKITSLLGVWKYLDKHFTGEDLDASTKIESNLLHSRNSNLFSKYLEESPSSLSMLDTDTRFFERISCGVKSSVNEVIVGLQIYSFGCLKEAVRLSIMNNDQNALVTANAHLQLARFCDRFLKEHESSKRGSSCGLSSEELAKEVVQNHLESIKYGNMEAVELFPRLLQIIESFPTSRECFINLAKGIPLWMFLRWNGQLVALLDKPYAAAVHNIVLSIAETYPMALVYNFKVSSQGFKFGNTKEGRHNKSIVTKIEGIFDGLWLVNAFIAALEQLDHPSSRFKDLFTTEIVPNKNDKGMVTKLVRKFYDEEVDTPSAGSNEITFGKVAKIFAKEAKSLFQKSFGSNLCKLKDSSVEEILKIVETLNSHFSSMETIGTKLLKDYSEWLDAFSGAKYSVELEIPGQYTGICKPLPEYHTKVAKFAQEVIVLLSIRKPKAITVIGNDCKEYKYLVKSGEDLRLDQRIQQLIHVMNGIYLRDGACKARQIRVITYQVVPLTIRLGWLEWVPDTIALKQFIESGMDENESYQYKSCSSEYVTFLKAFQPQKFNPMTATKCMYLKCGFDEATANFKKVVRLSPIDALRNSFWKMSSSPEAFIILRNCFVVSHAALSISHYILGIGDRHLSNFLVSLNSGQILGIDFGHSFGSATSILGIPELMPFRLTPQFLHLMGPMREHGLLQRTMVHALNALRNNPSILVNTMDVFIKEPSLDWENFATKVKKEGDSSWYPKQRIEFAKQKLDGRNCAYIMLDELRCGVQREKMYLDKLNEVCLGEKQLSLRSTLGDNKLSVEKQVLCLLDQATDIHVLSKTWHGWNPWM